MNYFPTFLACDCMKQECIVGASCCVSDLSAHKKSDRQTSVADVHMSSRKGILRYNHHRQSDIILQTSSGDIKEPSEEHQSIFYLEFKGEMAPFILQNGAMRVSCPLSMTWVIWQQLSLSLSGVMPVFGGRKIERKYIHTLAQTWGIVLSFAGWAIPAVTLISSVLSMSAQRAAHTPQGNKLSWCVSITNMWVWAHVGESQRRDERERGKNKTIEQSGTQK